MLIPCFHVAHYAPTDRVALSLSVFISDPFDGAGCLIQQESIVICYDALSNPDDTGRENGRVSYAALAKDSALGSADRLLTRPSINRGMQVSHLTHPVETRSRPNVEHGVVVHSMFRLSSSTFLTGWASNTQQTASTTSRAEAPKDVIRTNARPSRRNTCSLTFECMFPR